MHSPQDILKDLLSKKYQPVYFLYGNEPYFIDQISDYIAENALNPSEKSFNQSIIYGKDTDIQSLISTVKRYPMMAPIQVVIIKEAQNLKKIEELSSYIERPLKSTILVICYKKDKFDKRTKFALSLKKNAVLVESKKLYDDKIPGWISKQAESKGLKINPTASLMLADYLGNDLAKIDNELSKLLLNVQKNTEIDTTIIEKYVGISKEYNVFELNSAIGKRDTVKAMGIIKYMAQNPKTNPMVLIVTGVFSFFKNIYLFHTLVDKSRQNIASALGINPFFVPEYQLAGKNFTYHQTVSSLSIIREYDLKSKGVNNVSASEGELLMEMVYKIMQS